MLTPINSARKRVKKIVYDLEWMPGSKLTGDEQGRKHLAPHLRLVGVKDRARGYRSYLSVEAFLRGELVGRNHGAWFYAHAGGLADINFIFAKLLDAGFECSAVSSGSSLIFVTVKRGRYKWAFVDSYWTLRDRLAVIGHSIGVEKLSCAFDAPLNELITYNHYDCEILLRALERTEDELWELGGELKPTLASCAMNLFRRAYLTRAYDVPHVISDELRSGYFGGRVEIFARKIWEKAFYYDINSSFPWVMTQELPGSFQRTSRTIKPRSWVKATVRASGDIPPLPWRGPDALYFPVGEWEGWFYSGELEQSGVEIVKVHQVYEFESRTDLAPYVEDIYKRRKATDDEFLRLLYKLLMNSLYGKFGERREKQKLVINPSAEWLESMKAEARQAFERGEDYTRCELLIPGVFVERTEVTVQHEHVGLCGAITAMARVRLREFMTSARPVFYCDTDGFATTKGDVPTSNELGGLKLEKIFEPFEDANGEPMPAAEFVAPKIYRLGDKVKAKGFPLRGIVEYLRTNGTELAKFDLDPNDPLGSPQLRLDLFGRIARGDTLYFEKMMRVGEQLNQEATPTAVEVVSRKQFRNAARPKRRTDDEGNTSPWHVDEIGA